MAIGFRMKQKKKVGAGALNDMETRKPLLLLSQQFIHIHIHIRIHIFSKCINVELIVSLLADNWN